MNVRFRSEYLFALTLSLVACGSKTGLEVPDRDGAAFDRDSNAADATHASDGRDGSDTLRSDGSTTSMIVATLDGLRWELPCETDLNTFACTTPDSRVVSETIGGHAGEQFAVTLRFRGVVEMKTYLGGSSDGDHWQIGGTPQNDTINVYGMTISSPGRQYYLNRVVTDAFACFAIDYQETVILDAGATVTLTAQSTDGREVRNFDTSQQPIVVDGVSPAPSPFNGQFIQMDVVDVRQVR